MLKNHLAWERWKIKHSNLIMSLIISKIFNDRIRIESDTRIMLNKECECFFCGQVKTLIITPTLTISSAGVVSHFDEVLIEIKKNYQQITLDFVLDLLIKKNIESNNETSFLVCITQPRSEILKIENFKIEKNLTSAWIGDKTGFDKFQSCYVPMSQSGLVKRLGIDYIMHSCFRDVINDEKINSIGDIQICVTSLNGTFQYSGINTKYPSPKSIDSNIANGIYPMEGEDEKLILSAQNGDFQIEYLISNNGTSFGVYYKFGRFGAFANPLENNVFFIVKDCDKNEFIDNIYKVHQITLQSPHKKP